MGSAKEQSDSTNSEKMDKINELYKRSDRLNLGSTFTFWINVSLAVFRTVAPWFYPDQLNAIQIAVIILNIALLILNDYFFLYTAESERRRFAIQDGFDVRLSDYTTGGYYNNQLNPSEHKYFINIYESNYYTKDISWKMIPFSLGKIFLAIAAWFLTVWRSPNPGLVLIAAETVFSSSIIMKTAALFVYCYRVSELIKIPYIIYITEGEIGDAQRAMLFDYAVEYEAIKAHYKVPLDYRIYSKNRERLGKEWEDLKKNIKSPAIEKNGPAMEAIVSKGCK